MSRLLHGLVSIAALAIVCTGHSSGAAAAATYKLCALRDGPNGPCTCKSDSDSVGGFTVVDRRFCKGSAKQAQPKPKPPQEASGTSVQPAPKPEQPASAAVATTGATGSLPASRMARIALNGALRCGINPDLLGFSAKLSAGKWQGLDADFCRAVAAAVLNDPFKVEFIPLDAEARFPALQSDAIDLLSRNTTWTMARDVDLGLEFAGVIYFDGQSFMTSEDRGLVSAQQLGGLNICVQSGTTTEQNLDYYLKQHQIAATIQTFAARDLMVRAYLDGSCDAYTADRSSLSSERAKFQDPSKHQILPEVISKEPLGPAVAKGDRQWSEIVRWTLAGLINAEEVGLDRKMARGTEPLTGDALRLVEGAGSSGAKLGLDKAWLRNVVAAVGNYGEMFEANLGQSSPLGMERGVNELWKRGGLLFAPPMW